MAIRAEGWWQQIENTQGALDLFKASCVKVGFELKLSKAMITRLKILAERELAWRHKDLRRTITAGTVELADSDFIVGNRALFQRGLIADIPGPKGHKSFLNKQLDKPHYKVTKTGWMVLELVKLAGL